MRCGLIEQRAGGLDFRVHVGEHPLDGLEVGDGLAEGFAVACEFCGFIESGLRKANGLGGDADAAAVECGEGDLQALAFFAEAIGGGYDAIVENNFDGGRTALTHFVFVAADLEARECGLDEEMR